jgi:hypothetical protein
MPLAWLAILIIGCSCHPFPSRVSPANNAVIAFLTEYARCQNESRSISQRYDEQSLPGKEINKCRSLAKLYGEVESKEYSCRFQISSMEYWVRCEPNTGSGLKISFYMDESGVIRLSGEAPAGPGSPRLWTSATGLLKNGPGLSGS